MSSEARILVVDDDPAFRSVISDHLALDGFLVDQAESTQEAKDKLKQENYHLMLLDIMLPDALGTELLNFIHSNNIECKVIVLTGVPGLTIALNAMKLGASDYISKPFNPDYLLLSIHKALDQQMSIPSV